MAENKQTKKKMVYTPEHHIPIGEALKSENGEYALCIKKPKSNEVEIISIGKLMTEVAQTAEAQG